jgi:hypothetical protein
MQFKIANKINGFKHVSYGMAVKPNENTASQPAAKPV